MKVRDLVRLLESNEWQHVRTAGSHRIFKHPVKPKLVTVAENPATMFRQVPSRRS